MPELPEIVAHAERLSAAFVGIALKRFEPLHPAALKTFDPRPAAAAGEPLVSVGHRGKYLLLRFGRGDPAAREGGGGRGDTAGQGDPALRAKASEDAAVGDDGECNVGDDDAVVVGAGGDGGDGECNVGGEAVVVGAGGDEGDGSDGADDDRRRDPSLVFVVHLMQAGRLRGDAAQAPKPRGGMARWSFEDSSALLLTEAGKERRAGVWLISGDPDESEPLARLGPDADAIDRDDLARRLSAASERVHGFLRDQSHLAGIGRLLANEILHSARISPFTNASRLDDEAVDRLHEAIRTSIERGLAAERQLQDMGRSKNRPNDVHHRVGRQCPNCDDTVRAVEYRRYRVAYCPTCQTGGKVLADNTTSRFLK
ncbi:MAG: hypothetical protein OXD37_10050 [Acidimicrobiaceae bacterium]|nr:hypothetical protein [Acidimicrobiaceae bacterium]